MKKELIKKAKLPFKKMSDNEKDYVAAILEEVRANFKVFGESLDFVRKKGDATFEEVGRIRVEIEEIKDTQTLMQADISILKQDVSVLKQDVSVLKQDVSVLKQDVSVLKQDVSVLKQDVSVLKKDVSVLKNDVSVLKQDVKRIDGRLDNIEQEVLVIKSEINSLKSTLTQKSDIDFLKTLEIRLVRVEQYLKLAQ